jgi:hypothetical protein
MRSPPTLNLDNNNIGSKGAAALADAIKVNQALTRIDIFA